MKRLHLILLAVTIALPVSFWGFKICAQSAAGFQTTEYGTIRWAGRENTFFVRPSGKVEVLGPLFTKAQRPERVDERTFCMNLAVNAVAREGFEVVAMTSDEILVKRAVSH